MAEAKAKATAVAAKKETVKKAPVKKAAPAKKATPAKKAPAKKAAAKVAEPKAAVNFQFDGKSYTNADLIASAKDVWQYELEKKPEELKTIELYVKPEDSAAYYVFNVEITGSFLI